MNRPQAKGVGLLDSFYQSCWLPTPSAYGGGEQGVRVLEQPPGTEALTEAAQDSLGGARAGRWRSLLLPVLASGSALALAFIGALFTGSGISGANAVVEALSGRSGSLLGAAGGLLPLGFAYGAGMVSTVNPCGVAMLPAYLSLYLGAADTGAASVSRMRRLARALTVGVWVTAGFLVLFGITGAVIGAGSRSIIGVFPWLGLAVGVALTLGGGWVLRGGTLYSRLAESAAARIGGPSHGNARGYFLFGLSYGTASLSCTLPIFLVVVSSTLAVGGVRAAIGQFIVYALGMGTVIIALTLGMALFKGALVGSLRRIVPYVQPVSAVFMLLAGSYIIYYWLTLGGLLDRLV